MMKGANLPKELLNSIDACLENIEANIESTPVQWKFDSGDDCFPFYCFRNEERGIKILYQKKGLFFLGSRIEITVFKGAGYYDLEIPHVRKKKAKIICNKLIEVCKENKKREKFKNSLEKWDNLLSNMTRM